MSERRYPAWTRWLVGALSLPLRACLCLCAVIVPARRGLIVVIGRDGGAFLDNCKYMYLSLVRKREVQTVFVTERRQVFEGLAGRGLPVVHYPGWRGCWTLLRAQILIVDNLD